MAGILPAELNQLQDMMNRFMDFMGVTGPIGKFPVGDVIRPLSDIRDTDDAIIVTMDLPGIDKSDVDISISADNELKVVAQRSTEETSGKEQGRFERTYRRFERKIMLPEAVRGDEARARLNNGVLEITLPKEVVTTRTRISID